VADLAAMIKRSVHAKPGKEMKQEMKELIKNGKCTGVHTEDKYEKQYYFRCKTCFRKENEGCCVVCRDVCHKGHNVEKIPRFGGFYCDCYVTQNMCAFSKKRKRDNDTSSSLPSYISFSNKEEKEKEEEESGKYLNWFTKPRQRVFALGIGDQVSHKLVNNVASAGRGKPEYVVQGERLESKVMTLLQLAMQPMIEDVRVQWGNISKNEKESEWIQTPKECLGFFNDTKMLVYALEQQQKKKNNEKIEKEEKEKENKDDKVAVEIDVMLENEKKTIKYEIQALVTEEKSNWVTKLAAKSRIRELERLKRKIKLVSEESNNDPHIKKKNDLPTVEQVKEQLIKLSVDHQLLCSETAFVCVEDRQEITEGTMVARNVHAHHRARYGSVQQAKTKSKKRARNYNASRYESKSKKSLRRSRSRSPVELVNDDYAVEEEEAEEAESINLLINRQDQRERERERDSDRDRNRFRDRGRGGRGGGLATNTNKRLKKHSNQEMLLMEETNSEENCKLNVNVEKLNNIVVLQKFNGAYAFGDRVAKILNVSVKVLKDHLPEKLKNDYFVGLIDKELEDIWATLLVLAYLEISLKDVKKDWILMAEKSKKWLLTKQPQHQQQKIDACLQETTNLLKTLIN